MFLERSVSTEEYEGPRCGTYFRLGIGAVVDEDEGGDDVDDETDDGDEVRCQPNRHFAHEPFPPGLEKSVEEAGAGGTVLVLAQSLELTR